MLAVQISRLVVFDGLGIKEPGAFQSSSGSALPRLMPLALAFLGFDGSAPTPPFLVGSVTLAAKPVC